MARCGWRQGLPRADRLVISLEVPKLARSTQGEVRLQDPEPLHITSHALSYSDCLCLRTLRLLCFHLLRVQVSLPFLLVVEQR